MEEKREELGQMYLKNGLVPDVIKLSQEIDKYIVEQQKKLRK